MFKYELFRDFRILFGVHLGSKLSPIVMEKEMLVAQLKSEIFKELLGHVRLNVYITLQQFLIISRTVVSNFQSNFYFSLAIMAFMKQVKQ